MVKAWKIYVQCQYIYVIIHFYYQVHNIPFETFLTLFISMDVTKVCNCESYLHTILVSRLSRVFRKWRVRPAFLNPKHDSFPLSIRLVLRKGMQLSKNIAIRPYCMHEPTFQYVRSFLPAHLLPCPLDNRTKQLKMHRVNEP